MTDTLDCDLAIIGGGLSGGLVALAFAALRPEVRLLLVEQGERPGGNHVWSFFDGDVAPADRWLIDPLVAHRWPQGHHVDFPGYSRDLATPYNSVNTVQLAVALERVLGERLLIHATVTAIAPGHVGLADGRKIRTQAVIDARGAGDLSTLRCGWQKFVGHALRLDAPHGIDRPVIMDATVDQHDGYRFVYLLPWDDRTIFIEDTYYSDMPQLDTATIDARIAAYAQAKGWQGEVIHREQGVLPVVHGGDFDRYWPKDDPVARAGVRAGLFQPMTGYSLPDAVRFARWLADKPLDSLPAATRAYARAHWRRGGYYRLLGKMLFGAARPDQRWRIFARFYRLRPALIQRFYAGRSTIADRIRILCGRPPVPIRDAMRTLWNPPA
ncbi:MULTISPECIES: lycopene beta-cyclase CrtY [Sphingobium]|jgi:lycopene beta-cyclase|uniref:lycopene beta-cyclase CrtY n=1 Tax=Sphingobium TaxID=165695 RepID=UPI000DBB7868|nr:MULTISPECIES: lycopene beta-cyclase CrtY [Sphingobium]KAA9012309.1 lycopene beta-cyclase CrtY [Sphingobium limneticum]MBU0931070.1 lycopene beta-cyclase CrtY [Alphaproteobacteria bacterium]BBD00851.1 lycopene beta-cyclase [Sphingobium sp. YG1]